MATQIFAGHPFGLSGALIDKRSGAYYSGKINLQGVRVNTAGNWVENAGQDGEITSLELSGDYLEAEFTVLPENTTNIANAIGACAMPIRGTGFDATGFGGTTNIPIGPFTVNGICTTSANGNTDLSPWFFYSGTLNMSSTEHWTMTWTMRRYKSITTANVIT